MSEPIIKVNSLSKRYRIGAAEKGSRTFREVIMDGVSAPVRNLARLRSLTKFKNGYEEDVIWAFVMAATLFEMKDKLEFIARARS